ncbi:MAG TPA: DUF1634 domain-containing protein [Vicinamibacterales bacterium]|nr:DUF1634 domain-containing protein [Vicinamibacterales bacterium]
MTLGADLDVRLRWVPALFIALFSAALGLGLVAHVLRPGPLSAGLLQGGLVLLMAAPAARLLVAVLERIRRRDWTFVLMALVVAAELAVVMWRAATKN